ncbi:TPA: PavB family fibronectin-binding SSURE repeat adhesin [Streptococcus pneumoniae]|nr:PavB family fibronectin-binding SSURE repeat adhesin [Streptococcus pneumoniae]
MKFNPNQRYTRWSIRRLSVGVASVVVASGFFVLVGQPSSVRADGLNPTPGQVLPEETSGTKEGDLSEKPGDTVLTQAKPEGVTGNTNSLPTPTERTEVSEETSPSSLDTLFEKDEEAQKNPELTDVLKETVDTADVDGTQASPAETTPEQVKGGVKENTKDSIDVPAAYLEKAKGEGPFTAGVNHVIPYELFAGDGMLTRLLLKASDKAPWSDNGDAKNPALSPLGENVKTKGQYFYQVALDGNVAGKEKQALIDQFRANGTQTYSATVNVYGNKDGKPDLDNIVATKKVTININGLISKETVQKAVADNVKDSIDVPAAYLEKAKGEGPFTAGVNHVIPYELFAGDGMLTRLLLKASDKAPWSDNGDAKNPALSPLGENVKTKGQYFYQVALDGNVAGKEKQALIDQFRANGTQTYSATVNVYGNKDGKPDLDNIVATKKVTIKINVKETSDTANGSLSPSNSGSGVTPMNHNHATGTTDSMPADTMTSSTNTMAGENMAASANKMSDTMMSEDKAMLPNTGETQTSMASIGFLGLALAGLLGGLGLKNKKEEN